MPNPDTKTDQDPAPSDADKASELAIKRYEVFAKTQHDAAIVALDVLRLPTFGCLDNEEWKQKNQIDPDTTEKAEQYLQAYFDRMRRML